MFSIKKEDGMRKCIRCHGRKELYKIGGAYSFIDTGGVQVKCPMCNGIGKIKTLEEFNKSIAEKEINSDVRKESRNRSKKTTKAKAE